MASRKNRTKYSAVRALRSAQTTQSGRTPSYPEFYSHAELSDATSASYQAAYSPGSQGHGANNAYSHQMAASKYSRNNPTYSAASSRKIRHGKKIAIGVLAAILVVAIGGGTAFALWINSINKQLNQGSKTQEELNEINDALAAPVSATFTEPFYMMLIGTDLLDDDPAAGARSDTNIVVRVDPINNQATMVSIPRDTRISIDGYGMNKFNAAYNYDGAAGAIREASQLLDIDISYYAEVNFEDLKALVDSVGGVDIVVDERVDDPDADGTSAHPEWNRVIIEEGEQHLNGNQALVFARSRAYLDGDFTRTANQRKLIMAIVDKVLALPVTELPGVIQSAAQCVTTSFSVNDIVNLAQQLKNGGDLTIYSALVPSYTQDISEGGMLVSYVINDKAATKKMMAVVEAGGDPSTIESSISPSVQESSGTQNSGSSDYYDTSGTGTGGYYNNSSTSGYYDNSGTGSYYDYSGTADTTGSGTYYNGDSSTTGVESGSVDMGGGTDTSGDGGISGVSVEGAAAA